MRVRNLRYLAVFILLPALPSAAQQVLYSPFIDDRQAVRLDILGKAGDYYWIQKNTRKKMVDLPATPWRNDPLPTFQIFDSRMIPVRETTSLPVTEKTIKEYFICSDRYFDLLVLEAGREETLLKWRRYTAEGTVFSDTRTICSFSFLEKGNSFLLVRSADKTKILLAAFESVADSAPRLHTLLFDDNWNVLSAAVYHHPFITQPCVQYDFYNLPLEIFDNSPVKLADNGQLLMLTPSRKDQNYLLFHLAGTDTAIAFTEINTTAQVQVEQVSLSLDNHSGEVFTGILSRFRYSALKNVDVARYSFATGKVDFDSSYRFNTLSSYRVKNQNLVEENFIPVPGSGFLLLKEYGKNYASLFYRREDEEDQLDAGIIFTNNVIANDAENIPVNKNEFTRYSTLAGPKMVYDRGDLSMFYFPATAGDSCWSGLINQSQNTDFNVASLSYLPVSTADKTYFLYNSFFKQEQQLASTTVIDHRGNPIENEGIVFWKLRNSLLFQKAVRIAVNEVAVPYNNYRRMGLAVIRF